MLKHLSLFTAVAVISFGAIGQDEIWSSYHKAFEVIEKTSAKYFDCDKEKPSKLTYDLVDYRSGHYAKPGQQKEYKMKFELSYFGNRSVVETTMNYRGKDYTSRLENDKDSCKYIGFRPGEPEMMTMESLGLSRFVHMSRLFFEIQQNRQSLHFVDEFDDKVVVGFNDIEGSKFYLTINKEDYLIDQITQLDYSKSFGDLLVSLNYREYKKVGCEFIPSEVIERRQDQKQKHFKLTSTEGPVAERNNGFLIQESKTKSLLDITMEAIAENLHLISLNHQNARFLVAEYESYLTMVESPGNYASGIEIEKYIKEKFPNKELKYCMISHHHPDHGGAAGYFLRKGVKVITTEGNKDHLVNLSNGEHTLKAIEDPSVKSSSMSLELLNKKEKKVYFKKSKNPIEVLEVGEKTGHTEEFLMFYFPKSDILIAGDLVFFPEKGVRDQKKRAYSIYETVKENKLKIKKIYTTWPIKDHKDFGTMEDLKQCLIKAYPEIK